MTKETGAQTIKNAIQGYNKNAGAQVVNTSSALSGFNNVMSQETDPDLITACEIVTFPSKGMFYANHLSEVSIEYMTSKDEDLLTTPSLIENGTVLDLLLKKKVKTPNVNTYDLLQGDRNALILFLRTSSYGPDYTVMVTDPRSNGQTFKTVVNLLNLTYKEIDEIPDENGHFTVFIPMRKKNIVFRLLSYSEDDNIFKKADAIKLAYGEAYSSYSTLKLKASIVSIEGNSDRNYIDKFVDAMPALDAFTIRKKINEVSPDVNLSYKFTTDDGFEFNSTLTLGLDFFFPNT
jgi:hypothetical protein